METKRFIIEIDVNEDILRNVCQNYEADVIELIAYEMTWVTQSGIYPKSMRGEVSMGDIDIQEYSNLLCELYDLVELEEEGIELSDMQEDRYVEIVEILGNNGLEIPFPFVV